MLARERVQRRDRAGSSVDADAVCDALERALVGAGAAYLLTSRGPETVALVQCGDAELHAALAPLLDDERPLQVGTGRPVDHLTEAHHSLRDAELAIERLGYEPGRRLLAFEDFDLGTLLVSEAPMERIDPKIEEVLAPLRAHPLLLDAIEAYFEHEMDITRAAQALCLHPNTLRYRLGRLEQLLGLSLKQPSAIAALYIAMMAGDRAPE